MTTMLVFGGSGQLGTALRAQAAERWQVRAPGSDEVNLLHAGEAARYVEMVRPDVLVNAAAFTEVDDAEATERDLVFAINAKAPEAMARAARAIGAYFVHVSTDYVFDGTGPLPYAPTALPNPLSVYGASKLDGEQRVAAEYPGAVVVRTAWLHSGGGVNFIATAVRLLSAGTSMRVVDDQVGTPTRAANLAHAILLLAERRDIAGLQHFTDAGVASWYDVACAVRDTMQSADRLPDGVTVAPVDSSAIPRPARRPQVCILDAHALRQRLAWTPPQWRDGVAESTKELLDRSAR